MVRLWQGGQKAFVEIGAFENKRVFLDKEERNSLAERRQCCSMLAFISDCADVQSRLPLLLLLNGRHVTAAAASSIVDEFADSRHVIFLRRKTAWNSVELMVWIVGLLRRRLSELESHTQLVLLLDCAPCHAHARVAQAAARSNIVLVFVAASMTASLQPLDVVVFASLKRLIRAAYERSVTQAGGNRCTEAFLKELLHVSEEYLLDETGCARFEGVPSGVRSVRFSSTSGSSSQE